MCLAEGYVYSSPYFKDFLISLERDQNILHTCFFCQIVEFVFKSYYMPLYYTYSCSLESLSLLSRLYYFLNQIEKANENEKERLMGKKKLICHNFILLTYLFIYFIYQPQFPSIHSRPPSHPHPLPRWGETSLVESTKFGIPN